MATTNPKTTRNTENEQLNAQTTDETKEPFLESAIVPNADEDTDDDSLMSASHEWKKNTKAA